MTAVHLLGIGTATPAHGLTQADAAALACALSGHDEEQPRLVAGLYRRSGVKARRFAVLESAAAGVTAAIEAQQLYAPAVAGDAATGRGPGTARRMDAYARLAAPLALRAAQSALEASATEAPAITHLVTVSCTGFAAPGVDIALIRALGLDAGVERAHVGFMGCQGALNGLRVARALALTSPDVRVLLCCVELCGLHLQYSGEPDLVVANSLFADGAAAAVVGTAGRAGTWRLAASGAVLLPDSLDAMTWSIGDHGFTMTLSPKVPALIEAHLGPWLRKWLARHGLAIGDVASWAIHPGGTRVVAAVERALGLDAGAGAAAREVLAEHGNMSSPTVLFVLERLRARGAGPPCVALAFGPGLSVETALLA